MNKKTTNANIRFDPTEWKAFKAACAACGTKPSSIMRDLCVAAVAYASTTCKNGRWYPPKLVPDVPASVSGNVVQIHNGHGDQRAVVRKRKG